MKSNERASNKIIGEVVGSYIFKNMSVMNGSECHYVTWVLEKALLPKGVSHYTKEEMSMFVEKFLDEKDRMPIMVAKG